MADVGTMKKRRVTIAWVGVFAWLALAAVALGLDEIGAPDAVTLTVMGLSVIGMATAAGAGLSSAFLYWRDWYRR
jgi:hypothetical protein